MCCKTTVRVELPTEEIELVLRVAGFIPSPTQYGVWRRDLPPEAESNSARWCTAILTTGLIQFALQPIIGGHSFREHHVAAQSASIVYKVAQTLAERGDGHIQQTGLMGPCRLEQLTDERVIADYPLHPLSFDNLCLGFRTELLSGLPQLEDGLGTL